VLQVCCSCEGGGALSFIGGTWFGSLSSHGVGWASQGSQCNEHRTNESCEGGGALGFIGGTWFGSLSSHGVGWASQGSQCNEHRTNEILLPVGSFCSCWLRLGDCDSNQRKDSSARLEMILAGSLGWWESVCRNCGCNAQSRCLVPLQAAGNNVTGVHSHLGLRNPLGPAKKFLKSQSSSN
jgi:hypothetical protein